MPPRSHRWSLAAGDALDRHLARLTRCTSPLRRNLPRGSRSLDALCRGLPRPRRTAPDAYLTYRGKPHVGGQGVYNRHLTSLSTSPPCRGLCPPPYPIVDERIPFHPLPSLDIWADPHPMRKPRLWEWKDWTDALEHLSFATGTSPNRWRSAGASGVSCATAATTST